MKFRGLVALVALGIAGALSSLAAMAAQQAAPPPPQIRPVPAVAPQPQGRGRSNQPPPPPLVTTGLIVGRVVDAAGGRPVAGAVVQLSGGPSRSGPPAPPPGAAPQLPPLPPPRILTDSEGRFAFRNLTRGNYSLNATKSGYWAGAYGRSRPEGPTRPLQLDDGERMGDVAIRMFKLGSITGIVTDEAGEPIVGATVRADRRVLVAGRRVLQQQGQTAQTDDRGVYRLFNLAPAEYVVSVPIQSATSPSSPAGSPEARQNMSSTSQSMTGPTILMAGGRQISADSRFFWQSGSNAPLIPDGSGHWRGYATQYYMGARTAATAQVITLASGEERTAIDLAMQYVPTSGISGIVSGPTGPAANYVLRLVPSDTGEWSPQQEVATAVTDGSGAFSFLGVPSGQYVIQTVRIPREPLGFAEISPAGARGVGAGFTVTPVGPPPRPSEPLLWAIAPISVGDSDISGVGLSLREGLTVSGRLEFAGSKPRPTAQQLSQIPLVVESAGGRDNLPQNGPPSRVQPDGRFATTPRVPGKYFLRVGGAPSGFIVQSIMVNGVDATEVPIDLTSSVSGAVVTFTDLISGVSGTVRGVPSGVDPPAVVIFPSDSTGWKDFGINPSRMKMTRVSPTGSFVFGSLITGDYFAVAIRDEFSAEWQDPAFLEVLSRTAQRFTLGAGEKRTLDLQLSDAKPPGIGRTAALEIDLGSRFSRGGINRKSTPEVDFDSLHGPFVDDAVAPQQIRDGRTVEAVGSGSISGVVMLNDGSLRPARLARVSLSGGGLSGERTVLTNDEGRFTVAWLPAGDYQVMVAKSAFLSMQYGAKRPGVGPGTPVHLEAGQALTGINVTLQRGAVIAGIVLDPIGQPAANVRVQLQTYTRRDGERLLASAPSVSGRPMTDDRGAYRLYGLRPGNYVVSVVPPSLGSNTEVRQLSESDMRSAIAEAARPRTTPPATVNAPRVIAPAPLGDVPTPQVGGRPVGYSPVFYPGTTREQEAAEISLAAGQELNSVNMQIVLVPTARVEGRVMSPNGQPLNNVQVMLQRFTGSTSTSSSSVRQQDGVFQAVGVTVGRYFLSAFLEQPQPRVPPVPGAPPVQQRPPTVFWAQQEIDVTGADQLNLVLALAPPLTVAGRIVFEGATRPETKTVQVRLEPAGWPQPTRGPQPAVLDATGAFTITGVLPGKYRLSASAASPPAPAGASSGWSALSATIDGQDALVTPFEVRADRPVTNAVVTLTDQPAEISGRLIDGDGRPVQGMTLVLFPTDRASWAMNSNRLNRTTRQAADGMFRFTATLPGEYYLVVLTELDTNDWSDPAFKEQLTAVAIKVSVKKGEKKIQDMKIAGR